MSAKDSLRAELIREFNREDGVRLDDAALCADRAVRKIRKYRDDLIVKARDMGMSMRQIAKFFSLDVGYIHRVLTRAYTKSTPSSPILPPAA